MPIIKCPKCGEEYDSMYSSHSCEKSKKVPSAKNKKGNTTIYGTKDQNKSYKDFKNVMKDECNFYSKTDEYENEIIKMVVFICVIAGIIGMMSVGWNIGVFLCSALIGFCISLVLAPMIVLGTNDK